MAQILKLQIISQVAMRLEILQFYGEKVLGFRGASPQTPPGRCPGPKHFPTFFQTPFSALIIIDALREQS